MVDGKLVPRCRQRKQQNQVAILSVIEHLTILDAPPILVATTHLKAGKTTGCEELRRAQILQLLSCINQVYLTLKATGRTPAIILTGVRFEPSFILLPSFFSASFTYSLPHYEQ